MKKYSFYFLLIFITLFPIWEGLSIQYIIPGPSIFGLLLIVGAIVILVAIKYFTAISVKFLKKSPHEEVHTIFRFIYLIIFFCTNQLDEYESSIGSAKKET